MNLKDWLESIPDFPKPIEMKMEPIGNLVDMNVMSQFKPLEDGAKLGCEDAKYENNSTLDFFKTLFIYLGLQTAYRPRVSLPAEFSMCFLAHNM